MSKSIDERISKLESEIEFETKWRRERIEELKKEKRCEHSWEYTPYQKGDSFCFQRDVGETIKCTKCGFSIERDTHPNYSTLPPEQEAMFAEAKRGVV